MSWKPQSELTGSRPLNPDLKCSSVHCLDRKQRRLQLSACEVHVLEYRTYLLADVGDALDLPLSDVSRRIAEMAEYNPMLGMRGVRLLAPGGRLAFVVASKWLRASYGEPGDAGTG